MGCGVICVVYGVVCVVYGVVVWYVVWRGVVWCEVKYRCGVV